MRQAGRYLPEYRRLREQAGGFLTLCYTPEMAAEVTLQPVRRFGMDAAIVFSDILVVPHAMGRDLTFAPGEGPRLPPLRQEAEIENLASPQEVVSFLKPIAATLRLTRAELPPGTALIGFCGAPWTVACYMVEGAGSRDFAQVRRFALEREALFAELIDRLVACSLGYLSMQVEAGADIVQIFDSWAGVLSEAEYAKWVIAPTKRLIEGFRKLHPHVPVIGFPRASGPLLAYYIAQTKADAVSLDSQMPCDLALSLPCVLQGNLDPLLLACDLEGALRETRRIRDVWKNRPFIFNLGHGMLPFTPVAHVERLSDILKEGLS
jgi:uroporphyrinogen decarboxylase